MKTINVYEYDELPPEAQKKAREWFRDHDDYPFLSDDMLEEACHLLQEAGIIFDRKDIRVYYSLAYCQGDGAMIEIDNASMTVDGNIFYIHVKQSGHYNHYNSKDITIYDDEEEEVDTTDFNDNVYVPLCRKLEKAGYQFIENESSEENVEESLRANAYTFTIEGIRFG